MPRKSKSSIVRKVKKDGSFTEKFAGTTWYYNAKGQLHRSGDKPAVKGTGSNEATEDTVFEEYWVNGERHRDGGKPAVVEIQRPLGSESEQKRSYIRFYKKGELHNESGFAIQKFRESADHDGEL